VCERKGTEQRKRERERKKNERRETSGSSLQANRRQRGEYLSRASRECIAFGFSRFALDLNNSKKSIKKKQKKKELSSIESKGNRLLRSS